MSGLVNFAFDEHLVRVIECDGEPWFVGADVCRALDIRNARDAMSRLDMDERNTVAIADGIPGNPERVIISEPGVYRLVFTSRKAEAERFKRWIAHDVLPAIRRTGKFEAGTSEIAAMPNGEAPLAARVDAVRLAFRLFGRERAAALWQSFGLPEVPPAPVSGGQGEARALLEKFLAARPADGDGTDIRTLILLALEGDKDARNALFHYGVRVTRDGDGFVIANRHPALKGFLADTNWAGKPWSVILRRLSGAAPETTMKYGRFQSRGVRLSLHYLDTA